MNGQATVRVKDGFERRVYRRPWGVEIQLWKLAETITIPETAAAMSLSSLLAESPDQAGTGPLGSDDDDKTFDNLELDFSAAQKAPCSR